MKRVATAMTIVCALAICCAAADGPEATNGWISLFDGKTLNGWKVGNNAGSFRFQDGMIVANGPQQPEMRSAEPEPGPGWKR
jgi:hypothetical protein